MANPHRTPYAKDPAKRKYVKQPTTRNHGPGPATLGFSINQTWGALRSCWRAYKIAALDWRGISRDEETARLYAKRIRKLQAELGIAISEFPNLGLLGTTEFDIEWDCD